MAQPITNIFILCVLVFRDNLRLFIYTPKNKPKKLFISILYYPRFFYYIYRLKNSGIF